MASQENIETYKNYPEGSPGKQLYDKHTLDKAEYFVKYYLNAELHNWELWMESVNLAWNIESRTDFEKKWGERMKGFDYTEMKKIYNDIELSVFSEDIKKFIAFLAGDGFFKKNRISLHDWLDSKKFTNPLLENEQDVTIIEALKLKGGQNYIRLQLINLDWWK